ncbi:hypothetical protein [Dipodfec virus RodF1_49]|uniref:Uncharacterized protein n=1 Tax=Dipodfec virus RodF1_49 TaxID=2929299 RepID=A0A976R8X9_9VIRU|nr:hypothetical protein [Dipodfec virus RodF1_49]
MTNLPVFSICDVLTPNEHLLNLTRMACYAIISSRRQVSVFIDPMSVSNSDFWTEYNCFKDSVEYSVPVNIATVDEDEFYCICVSADDYTRLTIDLATYANLTFTDGPSKE